MSPRQGIQNQFGGQGGTGQGVQNQFVQAEQIDFGVPVRGKAGGWGIPKINLLGNLSSAVVVKPNYVDT